MEIKFINKMRIEEDSQIYEARRQANYSAVKIGFNETDVGRVSLVVTELATNIIKHTARKGGEILIQKYCCNEFEGLEIFSIDNGPGMRNVADCIRDGFSTAGSSGTGLGSVLRMSDSFDIYSAPNQGTVISVKFWLNKNQKTNHENQKFEVSGICVPVKGEDVCGDNWSFELFNDKAVVLVADGLGHGFNASEASLEAVKAFKANKNRNIDFILNETNNYLRKTRGAAVAISEVDILKNKVNYCGVGNIAGTIYSDGKTRSMISHNGIVGSEIRKIQVFENELLGNSILIMHSDGLSGRWDLDKYPGLSNKNVSLICGVLYRDFCRGNDDATVIALKIKQP